MQGDGMSVDLVIDLELLLKLRLVVARHGEMDCAKWWNTQGMLGPRGAIVLKRGFPSTHRFAQARIVFEVARHRCHEVFDPPGCMTLWHLPAELEEQFQEHWQAWLDEGEAWAPFFDAVAAQSGSDLLAALVELDLISDTQADAVSKLKRSAEGRAVSIPGSHVPTADVLAMLAAGFAKGEPGRLAVPYATIEGAE